jgi:hypothetical protein
MHKGKHLLFIIHLPPLAKNKKSGHFTILGDIIHLVMDLKELKQKLRALKKNEKRLRKKECLGVLEEELVWGKFFETRTMVCDNVKYTLKELMTLKQEERKEIFDEYFFQVFYQILQDSGLNFGSVSFNPELLAVLNLPIDAEADDIKKKFRTLAKKHHPDHGGEEEKMIEIIDAYNKLLEPYKNK